MFRPQNGHMPESADEFADQGLEERSPRDSVGGLSAAALPDEGDPPDVVPAGGAATETSASPGLRRAPARLVGADGLQQDEATPRNVRK